MTKRLPLSSLAWLTRLMMLSIIWLVTIFSVVEVSAQSIFLISKIPASGAVASGGRELSLTFNRSAPLTVQPGKELRIYRYSDDVLLQTLDLSVSNTNRVGDEMFFTLDQFMPHGEEVYVQIDYAAFVDFSANPDEPTPGILDDSWRFTVGSDRPEITSMNIISDNLAPVDVQLEINFDISVVKSNEDGISFGVYRRSDDFRVNGFNQFDVNLNTVTISSSSEFLGNLQSNTEYYVSMDPGYFVQHNSSVKAGEGIGQSNQYEWTFTTRANDGNAPDLVTVSPANGDQRVATLPGEVAFTMTFDEPIFLGNTSSKAILYRASDDFLVYNLGTNSSLSEDNLSVTFTTPNNLIGNTEYYILVDPSIGILGYPYFDADENPIAAIDNSNQWRFKTYGPIEKESYVPAIAAQDVTTNLTATLHTDAPLQWGNAGNIELRFFDDDQIDKTITNGSGLVSFDGTSMSVDLGTIDAETQYYIHIDNGAIIDNFGQNLTLSAKEWHFTTEDEPNSAPTAIGLSANTIDESNSINAVIGTLTTTDANAGDTHTYSLVTNPSSSFNINSNELRASIPFDFDTNASYDITIRTDDGNGGTYDEDFTISINDIAGSNAPTDITISKDNIDEHCPAGTIVGTLMAVDADGGTYTWAFLDPFFDNQFFRLSSGVISTDESFNFESRDSYSIRVEVTDENENSISSILTIAINDINEADLTPIVALSATSINEANDVGDEVGTLTTSGLHVGTNHTYSLVSGAGSTNNASFSISGGNQLLAGEVFDEEVKTSYSIRVRSDSQEGNAVFKVFTITIDRVNNEPTDITLTNNSFEENRPIGYSIGALNTTDLDNDESYSYSLVAGIGDDDNANFEIQFSSFKLATSFDFETQPTHSVRLRSEDGNGGVFEKVLTILVEDFPFEPITDIFLTNSSINEDNTIGDAIGTLSSEDDDAGDVHTYTLQTIDGSTDHTAFSIDGEVLEAAAVLDFETQSSYVIRVQSNDGTGFFFDKDFTITVNDIVEATNNAPTDIALSASTIDENNTINDIIGTLTTTDADGADTHTYSLVSNPGSSFNINGNELRASESFDFETTASYAIRIEADDQNGGVFEKDFTISINDVNENQAPTDITLTATSINENNELGDLAGVLSTTDVDVADTHTYSLVSNPGFLFRIVGDRLEANAFFNFESQDSYDITIRTTDGTADFQKEVTISINDINDLPDNIGLTNASITEDNAVDDLIGILGTSDEDGGATHSYTLESNPENAFKVNGNRLEANVIFDFNTQSSYPITVRSTDNLGGFKEKDFTITIIALVDNVGPQIVSFTPADGTEGILQSQEFIVTFNEPVQFGTGPIQIIRSGGSGQQVISATGTSGQDVISIDGSELTIHLDGDDRIRDLFFGGEYYVTISATAIQDLSNNQLTNPITDVNAWTFFAEKEPTSIVFDAIANKSTSTAAFDVSVTTNNNQTPVVYSILSGPATIDGNTITLTGELGTVNVQALQVETERYKAANISASFEVVDTTAPSILSFNPTDDATNVPIDGELIVTFDEPIAAGTSSILVRSVGGGSYALSGNATDNPDIFVISGNTLTIEMSNANNFGFINNQNYYVTINAGAVKDLAGNNFTSSITNQTDWNFTTERLTVTWSAGAWSNGTGPSFGVNVVIDDDYSVDADGFFSTHDLMVNPGNQLTVDGGIAMQVLGNLTNGGVISIESGFSLLTFEDNDIIGNDIIIKRNTRYADGKYSFVGSPVEQSASTTAFDLGDPAHHVYTYRESVPYGADGINRWSLASSQELIPGKGYAQAFQKEIIFEGRPNDGTITYTGTYTEDIADANEGWNLVANPYPIAIKVEDFLAENDNTSGSVYIWDDNGSDTQRGSNSDYIVANGSMASATNAGGESRYNIHLGSSQGFFVKLDDNSNTNILFTEEMRVAGKNEDGNFFRATQLPIVRLNLTNSEGLFKQTVIGFAEDATVDQLNRTYDAQAFNASTDNGLFTLKAGRTLTLNGMPNDWEAVQLQLNASKAGQFTIAVELEGYAKALYLRDNLTGEVVDLQSESYSFTTKPGIDTDRFELIAQPNAALGLTKSMALLYVNEKVLHIQQFDDEARTYQIFNMNGKRLLTTLVQEEKAVNLGAYPAGIYLVFDGQQTRKILLR